MLKTNRKNHKNRERREGGTKTWERILIYEVNGIPY